MMSKRNVLGRIIAKPRIFRTIMHNVMVATKKMIIYSVAGEKRKRNMGAHEKNQLP